MSYCDRLFPGNPRRRHEVEQLYAQFQQHALPNTRTVAHLMDYTKGYMHRQLDFAEGTGDSELQQACLALLSRMVAMRKDMRTVDKTLKKKLHPASYCTLRGIPEPRTEAALTFRCNLVKTLRILAALVLLVNVPVLCNYISTVVTAMPMLLFIQANASLVLILATVCLCCGVDVLLSLALGAWEKCQLKRKIKMYGNALPSKLRVPECESVKRRR
ncbi:single-pass membrane and coiled-coil domain-containing protein 3-like [Ambystoma mexicanum]|uniref:single-pass membrane and coiled-coil domain-containing protein 3-like n=1 Tax=Ambystoma mexicanum TaxID=8296 RepID=UPI0037E95D03